MLLKELLKISDPKIVYKKFVELGYDKYTNIYVSTWKDKKYMVIHPITNKMIHFGSTMEDYTYHKDEKRRQSFLKRNAKWEKSDKFSPGFLSYNLLW
jgi:hypothetical protein